MTTTAVVVSKDRPFQLKECLRSLFAHTEAPQVAASVIWCASTEDLRTDYGCVGRDFPAVCMLEESDAEDFGTLLRRAVEGAAPHVMFVVDDVVFIDTVPLADALGALADHPDVLVYHMKLHPGVWYCHTAGRCCTPPRLEYAGAASAAFNLAEGVLDWSYPWDLCGSVYRTADALAVLRALPKDAVSHPNRLEAGGAALWAASTLAATMRAGCDPATPWRAACPRHCVLVVVTVNRVQDVFTNAVFDGESLPDLNAHLHTGAHLDLTWYKAHAPFSSVHIGSLVFVGGPPPASDPPAVSVLVPVHNGATTVEAAVASVLRQESPPAEVVIVDDGSTDDTAAVLEGLAAADARVRVVTLAANGGVAAALRQGLRHCTGDFVARMDADDVCDPRRLGAQVAFLEAHPGVDVVGACVEKASGAEARPLVLPSHPLLAKWHMLFQCTLAHPTVMARREWFDAHPYDVAPGVTACEDYALWLGTVFPERSGDGLDGDNSTVVANVGGVLLRLEKHAASVSSTHADRQHTAALELARGAMARFSRQDVPHHVAACVRGGSAAVAALDGVETAHSALLVLQGLEVAWFACVVDAADELVPGNTPGACPAWQGVTAAALLTYVQDDVSARMGDVATAAFQRWGPAALACMQLWQSRPPRGALCTLDDVWGRVQAWWAGDDAPPAAPTLRDSDGIMAHIGSFLA